MVRHRDWSTIVCYNVNNLDVNICGLVGEFGHDIKIDGIKDIESDSFTVQQNHDR